MRTRTSLKLTVACAVAVAAAGLAQPTQASPVTLVDYTFESGYTRTNDNTAGNPGTPGLSPPSAGMVAGAQGFVAPAEVTHANITASTMTVGAGLWGLNPNQPSTLGNADINPTTGGNPATPNPSNDTIWSGAYTRGSATPASESAAISGNDYLTFTITPTPGFEMNLSSLSFDHARSSLETFNYSVRSSVDNFATTLGTSTITGTEVANTWHLFSIDLSVLAAYQELDEAVEFRIYSWDNTNLGNLNRIDNVKVLGTLVPEPASLVLAAVGAGLMLARRRRRA